MFASEGDLHLELPTGEREALRELWVSLGFGGDGEDGESNRDNNCS